MDVKAQAMTISPQEALAAFVRTEIRGPDHHDDGHPRPVITIARDYGAGGEEIGQYVAKALNVGFFDREILERIARAAGTEPSVMKMLDERGIDRMGMWVSSLINQARFHPTDYLRNLISITLYLARSGGVIMGRGAHLILHGPTLFRLRIVGSAENCARRVAAAEGGDAKALLDRVRSISKERSRFIWEHFHVRMNDPTNFDMILNTDRIEDMDKAGEAVLQAFRAHAAAGALVQAH